jgi:hypothetical protein
MRFCIDGAGAIGSLTRAEAGATIHHATPIPEDSP